MAFTLQYALEAFPHTVKVMNPHLTSFFIVSHGLVQMTVFFPQGREIQLFEYTRKELLLIFIFKDGKHEKVRAYPKMYKMDWFHEAMVT